VDECKLQAVKDSVDDPSKIYGSPEDNTNALKSLSAIELSESQSRECIVSTIMNNITNMLEAELNSVKNQLLSDFSPDDMCPTSTHFFEATGDNSSPGSHDNDHHPEAVLIDLGNDHDIFGEASESTAASANAVPVTDLLSIDQLLETVVTDPAPHTERVSVSTDMPFKEMSSQCEALTVRKHQKMASFMSFSQDMTMDPMATNQPFQTDLSLFHDPYPPQVGVPNTNPFVDDNLYGYPQYMNMNEANPQPTYEQAQQHFLRLPASSPYDNFRRAAGC
jgi:hypothetical protein